MCHIRQIVSAVLILNFGLQKNARVFNFRSLGLFVVLIGRDEA
jgi:hypothetical protein